MTSRKPTQHDKLDEILDILTGDGDDNDHITLALLGQKVDTLITKVDKVCDVAEDHERRLTQVEARQSTSEKVGATIQALMAAVFTWWNLQQK